MSEQRAKRGEVKARTLQSEGRSPLHVLPSSPAEASADDREQQDHLQLESLREQLDGQSGEGFWRSLDELAQTEEFTELMHREFPREAAEWDSSVSRRRFLQVAAAGLALTGMTGCTRQPEERIVAHVRAPENVTPGKPLHYASTASVGGYANGVLVRSNDGRPTKIEGNPDHPWSLGSTDVMTQASVLQLYDPDRSRYPLHLGKSARWQEVEAALESIARAQEPVGGADIRFLSSAVSSPTLAAQVEQLKERFPEARWIEWEPTGRESVHRGLEALYGQPLEVTYDLSAADVVVTLDADLLHTGPGALRYARQFAQRRRVHEGDATMNRLYSVESTPTPTGSVADHRLPLRASAIAPFAAALAAGLGVPGASAGEVSAEAEAWVAALVDDLNAHRGRSVVVAGDETSADLVALAEAINSHLGNVGSTVRYTEPALLASDGEAGGGVEGLKALVEEINAGAVRVLFFLDTNPAYDAPADLGFTEALAKVETCIHVGQYVDETARYCHWHVNQANFLEGWSDARAIDGTASVVQPLIEPLFDGKTLHQVLAALLGQVGTAYQLVESHWRQQLGAGFDSSWAEILHNGLVPDSALPPISASPVASAVAAASEAAGALLASAGDLELSFRSDPSVGDGRFANNAWLQEAPRPVSKLTWDNALLVSPVTVERLGLADKAGWSPFPDQLHGEQAKAAQLLTATGKLVRVTVGESSLELPVWVHPGQAEGTLTVHLGYGREFAGTVAKGVGFDVYPLRTSTTQSLAPAVTVEATGDRYDLASTQRNANIVLEGKEANKRHLVRTATLDAYSQDPKLIESMGHAEMQEISFYPGYSYDGAAWGMVIDLNTCTGCNACVVACQAENNVPTVGKEQVIRGREMHWLRIDRYYDGSVENPRIHSQPIPCMQCEQAPCETVCPVAATVHSEEGLNDMVYNRCVGTRYCSNNCPYKVRRFNFLRYSNNESGPLVSMSRNPDVTVRTRGVMEKCTYCVQRIKAARSEARIDPQEPDRPIRDGEVVTACQQACAADAIAFGDLNDPESRVAKWKATDLNYSLLEELGTRPRTTYLAKLRNPNPVLEPEEADHHGSH